MAASNGFSHIINAQISRSIDQVSTELQGEIVILNAKSGKYYNLNAVGSRIWGLIEQPCTTLSIIEAILNEYEVDRQQCEDDVCKVLLAMQHSGLVEIVVDTPGLLNGAL